VSEHEEDLELQALQRELDDAFATTRPRRGFEDELWVRMQSSRPARNRLRDAVAGFVQAIREVPAVPAAAVATVLVLALGVGLVAYSGVGRGGGGASTAAQQNYAGGANSDLSAGGFGRLQSPVLNGAPKATGGIEAPVTAQQPGAARYVWSGSLTVTATTAPVYRYHEPTAADADQLASSLGAVLRSRPAGLLGAYSASGYTLNIRGTLDSPPSSPTYFIIASPSMPAIDAASSNPADVATVFLAAHGLVPDWESTAMVDTTADVVRVRLVREFEVAGYGAARLVDASGEPYGIEVDLQGNRPLLVAGLLPATFDAADYRIVSPAAAIQSVISLPAAPSAASPAPPVQLTKAELVYVLVPAGNHSFYEPAYLFSGTVKTGGTTTVQHVLVPAVDPSQRTS